MCDGQADDTYRLDLCDGQAAAVVHHGAVVLRVGLPHRGVLFPCLLVHGLGRGDVPPAKQKTKSVKRNSNVKSSISNLKVVTFK